MKNYLDELMAISFAVVPHGKNPSGYRSTTFARMTHDGLIKYNPKNHGYDITDLGLKFLSLAQENFLFGKN